MNGDFMLELECLKASYDSSEFQLVISSNCPILKFNCKNNTCLTLEIPSVYPKSPPSISVSSVELTNSQRCSLENKIRELADRNVGYLMIMDLVTKLQQLIIDSSPYQTSVEKTVPGNYDSYVALILIDHMRQKKKYSSKLTSWASELNISGCLLFYQRWIFLLLQGCKNDVKEYIHRHKTVCVDIDSSGKPCKEKMSKILFESRSSTDLSEFFVKDMVSHKEIETYFMECNLHHIFNDVIRLMINKSKS